MNTLYACVHAREFPAQALLRLRPDFEAIAVFEGQPPHEYVCSLNRLAHSKGVTPGMTRLDVESIGGVQLLARSEETETAARSVMLECLSQFSPRIEEAGRATACAFILDITGTDRLFGSPSQLADRVRVALSEHGFRVSIAVSANYNVARMSAAARGGITVIDEGHESTAIAKLPIASLCLPEEQYATFALWGIRTLGELAALPEIELITRFGDDARRWHALARGEHPHTFQPIEPGFALREFYEFEDPIEQIDSLLFIGARMIDCLVTRAAGRALAIARLTACMRIEGSQTHEIILRPAIASTDRKFLLKLLQLELSAHPPQAPVQAFELGAEAGRSSTMQLGLFIPQTPEPSRLDVAVARLKAMVGCDRVGSPLLVDSYRPGDFRMQGFANTAPARKRVPGIQRMALRRVRPPAPIHMWQNAARPFEFSDSENRFKVITAYGPWRSSGCWWSIDHWELEEWDILADCSNGTSVACLLVCDRTVSAWRLEAFYD